MQTNFSTWRSTQDVIVHFISHPQRITMLLRTCLLCRFFCPLFHAFRLLQNRCKVGSFGLYTFSADTKVSVPKCLLNSIESTASSEFWKPLRMWDDAIWFALAPGFSSPGILWHGLRPGSIILTYGFSCNMFNMFQPCLTMFNICQIHCQSNLFQWQVRTASKASTRRDNFWMAWHEWRVWLESTSEWVRSGVVYIICI